MAHLVFYPFQVIRNFFFGDSYHQTEIKELPNELLKKIFKKLDFPNLCKTEKVCRQWNSLATELMYFDFSKNPDITDDYIASLAERYPHLKSIDLSFCNITDAAIASLATHCPNLKSIDLIFCNITDAAIASLATYCPNLKSIDLSYCDITDAAITSLAERYPHLKIIYYRL